MLATSVGRYVGAAKVEYYTGVFEIFWRNNFGQPRLRVVVGGVVGACVCAEEDGNGWRVGWRGFIPRR